MGTLREDFFDGLREGLRREGEKLTTVLADEVDSRGITNRGDLRKGFEHRVTGTEADLTLEVTGVSYANYVAEGTGGYSSPPPKAAIQRWVETKLNVPEQLVPSATFKIRMAIFREGTPTSGSPLRGRNDYVEGALQRRLPEITDVLERTAVDAAN